MKNQMTTSILSRALKMMVILSLMLYTLPSLAQPPACNAHFKNQPGNTLNSVKFSVAMNSPTTHYLWNFGDGGTSTQPNPVHTYPGAGVYYACLSIKDSSSKGVCTDSWCDSIRIGTPPPPPPPPACNAHFNFKPDSALNTLNFLSSLNPSGSTYSWNFGDGNTSTTKNPSETFPDTGLYYVCLTVTDSLGTCTNTWCDSVRIGKCIPHHLPPPPNSHCNAHFKFHGDSILYDIRFQSALNQPGTTYSWDFGDGNTSNLANPNNTYSSAGVYYVCLTVNDSACNSTWCDSVRVGLAPPPPPPHMDCDAHFKYNGDSTQTVKFFNAPNSPNASYAWDFGDGNTGTGSNPAHTYSAQGVYWVCLTVSDSTANGPCSNTWCDSVRSDRHFPKQGQQPCPNSKINASVFPNPMTENSSIHIDNSSGNVVFRVFDHNGSLRTTQQLGNGDYAISKETLTPGIHFYEVIDSDGNVTRGKFIVQ